MDRQAAASAARADDLLDLLSEQERDLLAAWMATPGNIDFIDIFMPPSARILTILGQSPAQDRAWKQKTPRPRFLREWLAARHWAIAAARSLQLAASLHHVPGLKPAPACQQAAQAASQYLAPPEAEDWLSLRMAD